MTRWPRFSWRRWTALAAWIAAALVIAVMAVPLLQGRVHILDDLGAFHLPTRAFYAQQLKAGEPFDWTPDLFGGFFLSGEGQIGGFHPLHWLLYRWLPLETAFELELVVNYPLLFLGTYLWIRRLLVRRDVALLAALAFTFGSFNLLHFVHVNAIAIVAHLPWILWAVERWIGRRGPHERGAAAPWLALIALLTASQLLLGYPQYVWFSLVAQWSYAAFRAGQAVARTAPRDFRKLRAMAVQLALANALGCLLGAIQLLPTFDTLRHSARSTTDVGFVNSFSLPSQNFLQVVGPYLLHNRVYYESTHELGIYFGAVPLALVVWLAVRRRDLGPWQPLARAAAMFAVLMVVLALGNAGVLYRLQRWLPIVGGFRCPCRYMLLADLAAMLLAALGFLLLVRDLAGRRQATARELRPLGVVVLVSVVVAVGGLIARHTALRPSMGPSNAILWGPMLIAAGAALVALAARGQRWAVPALVVFTALDLGSYGLSYAATRYYTGLDHYLALAAYRPQVDAASAADAQGFPPRVIGGENPLAMVGWTRMNGYAGLEPARRLDYQTLPALRVAGIGWVQASKNEPPAGLRASQKGWLEVPHPLPVVRLLSRAQLSRDPARDLAAIDIESTALTETPVDVHAGPPGEIDIVAARPGRLELSIVAPTRQLLSVAQSFHPGWRIRIDGRPGELIRVNGDFLGCVVEPGAHQVTMEFRPTSLWVGRWISLASLTGLCVAGGALIVLSRRKLSVVEYPQPKPALV